MKKFVRACALIGTLLVGTSPAVHAAWTFGTGSTVPADGTGVAIKSVTGAYAANGGTLSTSGAPIVYGSTYGISGFGTGASGTSWTAGVSGANLAYYTNAGLGMSSDSTGTTAPNHAIDNGPATNSSNNVSGLGNTEAVLLGFDSSVVLSSIGIGYKPGDADISLFRYTGAVTPATMLSMSGVGTSKAAMALAGWELVGNYDLQLDTSDPYSLVNAGSKGSSWWLISAYNSAYGAATTGTVDQGNDYFKLFAVAGTKCTSTVPGVCSPPSSGGGGAAPEPASLALVAVGLFGAAGVRRRRAAKAVAG